MKLFRRKPEYATAMPVHQEGHTTLEYAVQACDESGKPLTTHLAFLSEAEFARDYQSFRARPRTKVTKLNPFKKPKNNKQKLTSVKLNEIEEIQDA